MTMTFFVCHSRGTCNRHAQPLVILGSNPWHMWLGGTETNSGLSSSISPLLRLFNLHPMSVCLRLQKKALFASTPELSTCSTLSLDGLMLGNSRICISGVHSALNCRVSAKDSAPRSSHYSPKPLTSFSVIVLRLIIH